MQKYMSDRVAGVVLLAVAIGYSIIATGLKPALQMNRSPLEPGSFPLLLGILLAICSILLITKPTPDPEWPAPAAWLKMGLIILTLIFYGILIRPFGFVIATTLEMIGLALLFNGPLVRSILYSALFTVVLYALFNYVLGLGLPKGLLTFF